MPSWRQLNPAASSLPGESAVVPETQDDAVQAASQHAVAMSKFGVCHTAVTRSDDLDWSDLDLLSQHGGQSQPHNERNSLRSPADSFKPDAKPEFDVIENILKQTCCKLRTGEHVAGVKKCGNHLSGTASRTKKTESSKLLMPGQEKITLQDLPHPNQLRSRKKGSRVNHSFSAFSIDRYRQQLKDKQTSCRKVSSLSRLKEARNTLMNTVYGDRDNPAAGEDVEKSRPVEDGHRPEGRPSWMSSHLAQKYQQPGSNQQDGFARDLDSSASSFASTLQRVPGVLMSPVQLASPPDAFYDQASFWREEHAEKLAHQEADLQHGYLPFEEPGMPDLHCQAEEVWRETPRDTDRIYELHSGTDFVGFHMDSAEE